MSAEETAFTQALRHTPDDTLRLIYADYLEEHGDVARAEFLRLSVDLPQLWEKHWRERDPYESPYVEHIARTRIRPRELCKEIASGWLAEVHRGKVERCDFKTDQIPACPSQWEELAGTDNPLVRRCPVCDGDVRFCATYEQYIQQGTIAKAPFI